MAAKAAMAKVAKRERSELEEIPSVGPSIAQDLIDMGITRISDLKGKSPEAMYKQLEDMTGVYQDPCVLYTFRCAVYYASNAKHDPEKLKWWNWKFDSDIGKWGRRDRQDKVRERS